MSPEPTNPLELIPLIEQFLTNLPTVMGCHSQTPEWTARIKTDIGKIGLDARWLATASGYPTVEDTEWLYDLVWFQNTKDHYLLQVGMVLESEWSRDIDKIDYDFTKLLQARAPLKVMVFQDNGKDADNNLSQIWQRLETCIRTYRNHDPEDVYLLAAYQEDKHAFTFRKVIVRELEKASEA